MRSAENDMKNVVIYARYSSSAQTEQSIEGQLHVCEEYCKRNGYNVVETYIDRATSANKDIGKRKEFLRMIRDSEKDKFEAVIVYKLDRFSRNRYDSANYKYRLKKNGVSLISATENISSEPEGIILESVLEGMAEFYSAELSQKVTRGRHETAAKHRSLGGVCPLGYKVVNKEFVIDETTAPIVREAFARYVAGEQITDICRHFNAMGYKTSKGSAFNKNSFRGMFRNERYIGVYKYNNMIHDENAIPAIIDMETWEAAQRRNDQQQTRRGVKKPTKYVYLLQGKLYCGHCQDSYYGSMTGGKYAYYYCGGKRNRQKDCPSKPIRCENIDKLVLRDAFHFLTDDYIKRLAKIAVEENNRIIERDTRLPELTEKQKEIETALSNLVTALEKGDVPDIVIRRITELEKEQRQVEREIKADLAKVKILDEADILVWLNRFRKGSLDDPEFCRRVIDLFINRVYVWHEPDDKIKVTVLYNLTDKKKTYQLETVDRSEIDALRAHSPMVEHWGISRIALENYLVSYLTSERI